MLVLTRRLGERIVISDDIVVTVAEIKGDNIRLAIEAPKDVKIYRGEIYDAIAMENRQAAAPVGTGRLLQMKEISIKTAKKDKEA